MQIAEATRQWISGKGLLDANGSLSTSGLIDVGTFTIPADSGVKTALSRAITSSMYGMDDDCMLWIREYSIWPSSEDWTLFEGFRRSLGENSPLREKPGHLASRDDADRLRSLLAMVLYFVWGAVLIGAKSRVVVTVSHDEVMDVFAPNTQSVPSELVGQLRSITERPRST